MSNSYVTNLKKLIVGTNATSGQIYDFISKEMRPQDDFINGARSEGKNIGRNSEHRVTQLLELGPKYKETAYEGTTYLVHRDETDKTPELNINNNPNYPPNIIDRFITPFEFIEKILLQDFSSLMKLDGDDDQNYFRDLFRFTYRDNKGLKPKSYKETYGITGFTMVDEGFSSVNYNSVNDVFQNGEFFLDSFTYTPFVDYATTDPKIGIYSDEFLTDYNYGKYNENYTGIDKKLQADVHRHRQSSTLFELRNLEKDIHDAKTSFRNAISMTDSKSYIYVFCEHIAKLFAKLSNIRMCHEIYGFKHPHCKWEGILALDIWYNLLYKNIDAKYPFDYKYFNMNPMSRKQIFTDESGREYVESDDVENATNGRIYKDSLPNATLEWIDDETIGDGVPDEFGNKIRYAFIWNDVLWHEYNDNCLAIANIRKDCVLPRGVLTKVNDIVRRFVSLAEVTHKSEPDNDYDWFYQLGKVYQESHRSAYTKYTNLHLGCAYDVMSAREYHELTNNNLVNDQYVKPRFGEADPDIRDKMLEQGYYALSDAFEIIKSEKIFNIYNSKTNSVEEFNPENVNQYSQSQCAIVIERVFSRLYKYLQFKSTTGEVFQRHINIDSGYKYLTTETLKHSHNPNANVYYDDNDKDDVQGYLRYLTKIEWYYNQCKESHDTSVLTPNECDILGQFLQMLSKAGQGWLLKNWNLCPLCEKLETRTKDIVEEVSPQEKNEVARKGAMLKSREMSESELDVGYHHRDIYINFNLNNFMQWTDGTVEIPSDPSFTFKRDLLSRPSEIHYVAERDDFQLDLSKIKLVNSPTFTDTQEKDVSSGLTVQYKLIGFSTNRFASTPSIDLNDVLTKWNFSDSGTLSLYAVWNTQYIVKFLPGDGGSGKMNPITVRANELVNLPKCTFVGPEGERLRFEYHNSPTGYWEFDSPLDSPTGLNSVGERLQTHKFANWQYSIGGSCGICYDEFQFGIQQKWTDSAPIVVLRANWTLGYDILTFKVGNEPYCDVLIDKEVNTVIYPLVDPKLSNPDLKFLGWSSMEGDVLPGIEGRTNVIICDDTKTDPLANTGVSASGDNQNFDTGKNASKYIICEEKTDVKQYQRYVTARIHAAGETEFKITFKYIDSDGHAAEKSQDVKQNQHIPSFHLHLETNVKSGDDSCMQYVFRYWNLVSGNITSSMTILSDSVLVAVYDKVVVPVNGMVEDSVDRITSTLIDPHVQCGLVDTLETCTYWSGHPDINKVNSSGEFYCTLVGLNPETYGNDFLEFANCPFLSLLNRAKTSANDFKPLTMIEISDVVNLLKALFKINIHIAHTEYFLRIDIPEKTDWWYGYTESGKWISFEPTVEFKFSNFHTANQVEDGRLVCRVDQTRQLNWKITPVNRELIGEYNAGGVHYNDLYYYYDYRNSLQGVQKRKNDTTDVTKTVNDNISTSVTPTLDDQQNYYDIRPLCLYENSTIQSPVDANDFLRHRLGLNIDGTYNGIERGQNQLRTFTSIVKKYRPIIMPKVRDIFNDCDMAADTKYQADVENRYGVFGWCTIPSKTMVNMEYNEDSLVVPSSYDMYNRIGGYNFLQMDRDFHLDVFDQTRRSVYEKWVKLHPEDEDDKSGFLVDNIKSTWYYLYNQRDWTYFLIPFFNIKQNSELYSFMLDTYQADMVPKSSDHINGIIFEQSNEGRAEDPAFGDIVRACEFLAKRHHNENNLKTLAERFTKLIPYQTLKQLTVDETGEFNGKYGSQYNFGTAGSGEFRFPYQDWVDDYDKGGSFVDLTVNKYVYEDKYKVSPDKLKYKYNLSQAHAIDDFDEDSVWFYITMVSPLEDLNQVVELEDIMPYVFWWENRGDQNNGPTVDCYGRISSAKLNYEEGGYCYSNAHEKQDEYVEVDLDTKEERRTPTFLTEHKWHAVQHTIGTDFAKREYGGTVLTTDNSGNCYKGVFDPNCAGTNEKWKIHHISNAFGAPQHEDPTEDKYYFGEQCHGDGDFRKKFIPESMNTDVLASISERPMTWNLWNVVRHYAYIKYFKNKRRELGDDFAAWQALEKYTQKIVRSIYRTFKQNKWKGNIASNGRNTFGDVDGSSTNYGTPCYVHWTNSFVEISNILERNAREHEASFVMFTGNIPKPTEAEISRRYDELVSKYTTWKKRPQGEFDEDAAHVKWHPLDYEMARASLMYERILNSHDNFRVTTLEGVDDDHDGMRPRELVQANGDPYDKGYKAKIEDEDDTVPPDARIYQGFKFEDIPANYIIGDSLVYQQLLSDTDVQFPKVLDMDKEFPESEFYLNDTRQKWIRKINKTILNKQLFPVYTSMETMNKSHHDLTIRDMKSITFQVIPQFYWRYEWSYNELYIHRVGKLLSPSNQVEMYDMLGNVWEWVRDDWKSEVAVASDPGKTEDNPVVNPIITVDGHEKKVIKGGAFDQLCRKVICGSREGLEPGKCKSKYATQANVGFRPSMVFTSENEGSSFEFHTSPVDLFFLFDASASQNNQITKMIESATDIVRMFAGYSETSSYDVCHVGSALFLGPTLRFMCCHKCDSYTQIQYGSYEGMPQYYNWKRGEGSTTYHYYLSGGGNTPFTEWYGGDGSETKPWHTSAYNTQRKYWTSGDFGTGNGIGVASGFETFFDKYQENCWMTGGEGGSSARTANGKQEGSIESEWTYKTHALNGWSGDYEQSDIQVEYGDEEEDALSETILETLKSRGNDTGGSGGHSSTPSSSSGESCFVAGTYVEMSDGTLKNIEDVVVGDKVVSYDEVRRKNEISLVAKTMKHDIDEDIYTLYIEDEVLKATYVHPFYVMRNGIADWVKVGDLVCSDKVMFHDGTWHEIVNIDVNRCRTAVYNLEVTNTHTYYVGKRGVLVHNKEDPPPEYPQDANVTIYYYNYAKKFNVFCGVPAWINGDSEYDSNDKPMPLTFGGIPAGANSDLNGTGEFGDWTRYFAGYEGMTWDDKNRTWNVPAKDGHDEFSEKVPFFTYNPTDEGLEDFEFPFVVNERGVLSNWWAGCEPTCRMLSKLIRKGYFYGYPRHQGLGYLFRKKVPRLVFVFANEYDNEMKTTYSETGGVQANEILYTPGIPSSKQLQFYGGTSVYGKDLVPPDPYCLQMMRGANSDTFKNYCDIVGLQTDDAGSEAAEGMSAVSSLILGNSGKFRDIVLEKHKLTIPNKWTAGNAVNDSMAVTGSLSQDMQNEPKMLQGMAATKLLTESQKKKLRDSGELPGNSTEDNKHYVSYDQLKTAGFFHLRNTMALTEQPVNSYMFVSDANAPVPLYDTDNIELNAVNALEIAKSFFLNNEQRLFKDMDQVKIDNAELKTIFKNYGYVKDDEDLTWRILRMSNNALQLDDSRIIDGVDCSKKDANILDTIFGLENPYTHTNMVFATRHAWGSFLKKKGVWENVKMDNDTGVDHSIPKTDITTTWYDKYFFIMGLPACRTINSGDATFAEGSWRREFHFKGAKRDDENKAYFANYMTQHVVQALFPHGESDTEGWVLTGGESDLTQPSGPYNIPVDWAKIVYDYAKSGTLPPGKDGESNIRGDSTPTDKRYILSDSARQFIDKHLCPLSVWDDKSRREKTSDYPFRRICKYTLTEESIELIAVCLCVCKSMEKDEATNEWNCKNTESKFSTVYYPMFIEKMCSALSPCVYGSGATSQTTSVFSIRTTQYQPPVEIDSRFAWTKDPLDYITITYKDKVGEDEVVTGHLKIIVHPEKIVKTSSGLVEGRQVCATDNLVLDCNPAPNQESNKLCDRVGAYATITNTSSGSAYPPYWKFALYRIASEYSTSAKNSIGVYSDAKEIWSKVPLVRFVKDFYVNFKKALPILMGYRWQHQVFDEMTNSSGRSLTDYEDEENTVVVKSIPVMDVTDLKEVFRESFTSGSGVGNLSDGRKFSYKYAVIDLLPDLTEYNKKTYGLTGAELDLITLKPNTFPMRFKDGVKVNKDDEFKTTKIVLSRIQGISGDQYDSFVMGSHASDYDLVTDPNKRKYRDSESIVDGAPDDFKYVTLGNGGSYQRKFPNVPLNKDEWPETYTDAIRSQDFYNPDVDKSEQPWVYARNKFGNILLGRDSAPKKMSKYFRNKHFFLDPFELTIAQWCYVYGLHKNSEGQIPTKDGLPDMPRMKEFARANLAKTQKSIPGSIGNTNFKKMEKSYWKYVCVWENEEWNYLLATGKDKNGISILTGDQLRELTQLSSRDTASTSGTASAGEIEPPSGGMPANGYRSVSLTETQEKLINKLIGWGIYNPLEDTRPFYYASYNDVRSKLDVYSTPPSGAGSYVLSRSGDEFQLVANSSTPMSFMDILNSKVVVQTQKRIYGVSGYENDGRGGPDRNTSTWGGGTGTIYNTAWWEYQLNRLPGAEDYDTKARSLVSSKYDKYGGSPLMQYLMDARDNKLGLTKTTYKKKRWSSGELGGINFDLPTEAQWEYCCRTGSVFAIPPWYNLAENFEEKDQNLDLISWYKYKVIGSLPEPERFCAWRISKMLFGISKDKEQINNVYETTY